MAATMIFKYVLKSDVHVADMPAGARILKAGIQNRSICVWALVSPDAPRVSRLLTVYGTGAPISSVDQFDYVDTVFVGPLVWHVFAEKELPYA